VHRYLWVQRLVGAGEEVGRMTLNQLRIFEAVARHCHFTRAAEELYLSQPSVSVQVRELEKECGLPLLTQQGKRVYLTDEGRLLADYAVRVLALVADAQAAMAEARDLSSGRLHVGASTTVATYVLPRLLGLYKARHPGIAVHLVSGNSEEIQRRLVRNELDFGLVEGATILPDLVAEPYMDDELVPIVAPSDPLVTAASGAGAGLLMGATFILREPGSGPREVMEAALRAAGVQPLGTMELGSTEAIKRAVAAGLGVSLVSRYALDLDIAAGLLVVPDLPWLCARRTFQLVRHPRKRLSRAAAAFHSLLLAHRDAEQGVI